MSRMVPFSQRNACSVGSPVVGFRVESVVDHPETKSTRWLLHPPIGDESRPPSVPKSRITPSLHMKACIGELHGLWGLGNGSRVVSTVANHTTSPALLTYSPALLTPR